jgi:hypothetical protein
LDFLILLTFSGFELLNPIPDRNVTFLIMCKKDIAFAAIINNSHKKTSIIHNLFL